MVIIFQKHSYEIVTLVVSYF